jgi:hypothetical protein
MLQNVTATFDLHQPRPGDYLKAYEVLQRQGFRTADPAEGGGIIEGTTTTAWGEFSPKYDDVILVSALFKMAMDGFKAVGINGFRLYMASGSPASRHLINVPHVPAQLPHLMTPFSALEALRGL